MSDTHTIIDTGYRPRDLQKYLHEVCGRSRFSVIVCHRRWGKTVWAINEMGNRLLTNPFKNPQGCYLAPTYSAAKRIAWEYIKQYTPNIPGVKFNESELTVYIPRPHLDDHIKIFLLSAENYDMLRGLYLDEAILDEVGLMDELVWTAVIRPALSDRKGRAIFIGTPAGRNFFYDLYKFALDEMEQYKEAYERGEYITKIEWFAKVFRASDTNIIDADELASLRKGMDENTYLQEFECSFTAGARGTYYTDLMNVARTDKRITNVPYDEAVQVIPVFDLGISDACAVWFAQFVGKEVHLINYKEYEGKSLPDIIRNLQGMRYVYGEMHLPHDAAARELGTGKSREEVVRSLWNGPVRVLPKAGVQDGIDAVRRMLPMCWFDEKSCKKGIDSLEAYTKEYDTKKKIFSQKPLHDWASHGADAFRYLAMSMKQPMKSWKHFERDAQFDWSPFKF
jgi:hypothetical protein